MHTIDGKPAYYDGDQICFACGEVRRLCNSLKELRNEQKRSREWRAAHGFSDFGWDLRYVRVRLEVDENEIRMTRASS